MPSQHESVAIAQTIFYLPIILTTIYILVKNWTIGPRMSRVTWFTLAVLALMRFTGGILIITRESDPDNVGLTIATVVLLNVGLVPLIMSTLGIIGIVLSSSTQEQSSIHKTMIVLRLLFVTALTLFIAGGAISLDGHSTGDNLVKAAYIIFTAIVAIIIAITLHLRVQKSKLAPKSLIYLHGAAFVIPFLIMRIVYGVLSAFLTPYTWSPLVGSPVAFALMALLPEYIITAIYTYLGFYKFREHAACYEEAAEGGGDQPHTQELVDIHAVGKD